MKKGKKYALFYGTFISLIFFIASIYLGYIACNYSKYKCTSHTIGTVYQTSQFKRKIHFTYFVDNVEYTNFSFLDEEDINMVTNGYVINVYFNPDSPKYFTTDDHSEVVGYVMFSISALCLSILFLFVVIYGIVKKEEPSELRLPFLLIHFLIASFLLAMIVSTYTAILSYNNYRHLLKARNSKIQANGFLVKGNSNNKYITYSYEYKNRVFTNTIIVTQSIYDHLQTNHTLRIYIDDETPSHSFIAGNSLSLRNTLGTTVILTVCAVMALLGVIFFAQLYAIAKK